MGKSIILKTGAAVLALGLMASGAAQIATNARSIRLPLTEQEIIANEVFVSEYDSLVKKPFAIFNNYEVTKIVQNKQGHSNFLKRYLDQITELEITEPLTDTDISDLRHLTNLQRLTIKNNTIDMSNLSYNLNLTELTLSNCTVRNFSNLPNSVKTIDFEQVTSEDNSFDLPYFTESIRLTECNIRNLRFKNPASLKTIYISGNSFIDAEEISKCTNLEKLTILFCLNVKNAEKIVNLPNLQSFSTDDYATVWMSVDTLEQLPMQNGFITRLAPEIRELDGIANTIKGISETDEDKIRNISIFIINQLSYDEEVKKGLAEQKQLEERQKESDRLIIGDSYAMKRAESLITAYNYDPIRSSLYSNSGVCINYTALFQALINRVGLNGYSIISGEHAYNAVNINGQDKGFDLTAVDSDKPYTIDNGTIHRLENLTAEDLFNVGNEQYLYSYNFDLDRYFNNGYEPDNLPAIIDDIITLGYVPDNSIIQVRRNFKDNFLVMTKGLKITLISELLAVITAYLVNKKLEQKKEEKRVQSLIKQLPNSSKRRRLELYNSMINTPNKTNNQVLRYKRKNNKRRFV